MKKFLVVLLSLGLIVAFSATASAVDVKFGGQYYLVGTYWANSGAVKTDDATSRAFFYTRTRIQPVFTIAEGLTFTVRFDALEKQWGQTNFKNVNFSDETLSRKQNPTYEPGRGVQENIEFERAYVTFKTAIGGFQVGYQAADEWGTAFGDSGTTRPRIAYILPLGPVTTVNAIYEKWYESDTAVPYGAANRKADADYDTFALAPVFKFKGGDTGLLFKYYANASQRDATLGAYRSKIYQISPYAKATFGPVYVEGEFNYWGGKAAEFDAGGQDKDMSSWTAYAKAQMNLGPAYVGAQFGYATGDDGTDASKTKLAPGGGGTSWNPALILMYDDLGSWCGGGATSNPTGVTSKKLNMMLAQAFGGFKVTPKFELFGAVTWAKVNEKKTFVDDKLGWEIDLTATYKIYNNLSYMVGAGYLFTGDYFKGANQNAEVGNDYLLLNKLTLSF